MRIREGDLAELIKAFEEAEPYIAEFLEISKDMINSRIKASFVDGIICGFRIWDDEDNEEGLLRN